MPALLGPPKKNSMYVVTFDNATGALVKIEALDEETGKRKELSRAQYAQAIIGGGAMGWPLYGAMASSLSRYAGEPAYAAGFRAMVSPLAATARYPSPLYGAMSSAPFAYAMSGYPFTYGNPAVQAYFQGMMDYLQHCAGSS
jgi:hypothetical protein